MVHCRRVLLVIVPVVLCQQRARDLVLQRLVLRVQLRISTM